MKAPDTEQAKLLRQRLADDLEGGFTQLVLTYQDRLFGLALRLTGSRRDAEEVAQDAFVRAYRALRSYPVERLETLALKSWLYQITLNLCRNRLRGKRPGLVSLDHGDDEDALDLPDEGAEDPGAALERAEEQVQLARAVAALPERYRVAVVLRHVEGLSYVEAAAVLRQPVGTVKANVHRGIQQLRAMLAEQGMVGRDEVEAH